VIEWIDRSLPATELFGRIDPLSPDKRRDTLPPNLRGVT
jgi:hypothetical protein